MRIFFKIIRYALLAALVIMLAALVILLWTERDPESMSRLAWTGEAAEKYSASDNGFKVVSYTGFDDRTYSQNGLIGISRVSNIVDISEWQMLVRYNDSTLKTIAESRGPVDYDDTERFVFTLEDSLGHVYTDYHFVTARTGRHCFVRLIFDGVDLSFKVASINDGGSSKSIIKRVEEMRLMVYCREDVQDGHYPDKPECYLYIYGDGAAQYDYKNLDDELPVDGAATEGIRSSKELFSGGNG